MAVFSISSGRFSFTLSIDGSKEVRYKFGDLIPATPDRAGAIVRIKDRTKILTTIDLIENEAVKINLAEDTITVNGRSDFANAGELFDSLLSAILGDLVTWHKFGFNTDVDTAVPEILASFGGSFEPSVNVMKTDQTFNIAYTPALDGATSTGARVLLFYIIRTESGRVVEAIETHVLGSSGSDVTTFSGLGINRVVVVANGGLTRNGGTINITASTDGTFQGQIPLGVDGRGTSSTEQIIFHTPQNSLFEMHGLEINCLRLTGGQAPVVTFYLLSYSRVTNTVYRILSKRIDTAIRNDISINFGDHPLTFGGREIIYAEVSTNVNNTIVNGRFYGDLKNIA